jgi:hypothetical protein
MRRAALVAMFIASLVLSGCFGQSKATGKYSNQDKPKPVENPGK